MVGGHLRTCGSWGLPTAPAVPSTLLGVLHGVEAMRVPETLATAVDPGAIKMPQRGDNPTLAKLLDLERERELVRPSALVTEVDRLARLMHPGGALVCPGCGQRWDIDPPVLVQDDVRVGTLADPDRTTWVMRWEGTRAASVEAMLLEHLAGHAAAETGLDHPDDPGPVEPGS